MLDGRGAGAGVYTNKHTVGVLELEGLVTHVALGMRICRYAACKMMASLELREAAPSVLYAGREAG